MTRISPSLRAVEPADGKDPFLGRHQIDHARPAAGIVVRRDDADRLVDGEVEPLRLAERLAIDANFLPQRIDAGAQLGDDLAIDLDAARRGSAPRNPDGCRRPRRRALFAGARRGCRFDRRVGSSLRTAESDGVWLGGVCMVMAGLLTTGCSWLNRHRFIRSLHS